VVTACSATPFDSGRRWAAIWKQRIQVCGIDDLLLRLARGWHVVNDDHEALVRLRYREVSRWVSQAGSIPLMAESDCEIVLA